MGPSVPVRIDDKDKFLRFGVRNSRLATSTLQQFLPSGADKLDIGRAAQLVARGDQDAIIVFLWYGLGHDDERLTQQQVERWAEAHVDKGGEMGDLSGPVLEALKSAGLIKINYKATVDAEGAGAGRPQIVGAEASRE